MRERPENLDATDLAMRGWALLNSNRNNAAARKEAMALFERALALEPKNIRAMTGLADALNTGVSLLSSQDPQGDIARSQQVLDAALTLQPDNALAHGEKGWVYSFQRQWAPAIAQAEAAIADDRNRAADYAEASFRKMFLGRSEDGFTGVEKALRLSPRDPLSPLWQFYICHLHTHLAQWEQAIEWCNKSIAGDPNNPYPLVDLAAANAWAGHDKEAKDAAAQLRKVHPGFTVQTWLGIHWSDDPTFNAQYQRIAEGLRKAGVPEGDKKTD
jgi:tetratricopeptide (TPR) repeat protein